MFFKKKTVLEVMQKYAGLIAFSDEEISTVFRELSSTKAKSKIKTISCRSDLNRLAKKYDIGVIQGRKIRWYYHNTYVTIEHPYNPAVLIAKPKSIFGHSMFFTRCVKIFRYNPK